MDYMEAEAVVQGQVEAYNDHDVEKFASFYSDEISIYDLSGDKPATKGIFALKKCMRGCRKLHQIIVLRLLSVLLMAPLLSILNVYMVCQTERETRSFWPFTKFEKAR